MEILSIILLVLGAVEVIGGFIALWSKFSESGTFIIFVGWGCMLIGALVAPSAKKNENNPTIEISTEVETVTESQSVKSSSIKVVILNKYNGAEIISDGKLGKGYFIYEQEKYSYELDDNILFISKDNKVIDYLYVN